MSESQVPFKDFLIFLFHSTSSSPSSSTRVNCPRNSNTLLNRDLVKNTFGDALTPTKDNNNPLVNKSKPLKKSQSSQKTTMIYGRQVKKKIISSSSSSPLPTSATPEDLGRLNILLKHQVPSISKESKSNQQDHKLGLKKSDQHQPSLMVSDQNEQKNNIGQKKDQPHIRTRRSTYSTIHHQDHNNVKQNDEDVQEKDLQEGNNKNQHETLLSGHKDLNHDDDNVPLGASGGSLNIKEIRQESQSTSSNSSYRELLGEYDYHHLHHHDHNGHNHICRSEGKNNENDDSVIIDDNHIDFQYDDRDHLHVHENHDLSFYKNFSATTRSKSSTACSIFSKSITDDNHHYRIHHQHIFYSLSKRLSRSTPVQLDVITSVSNESIVNPMVENVHDDHHFLESHLYHDDDDDNYQYDQFETFPNSPRHSSGDNQCHNNLSRGSSKCSHTSTTNGVIGGGDVSTRPNSSNYNNKNDGNSNDQDLEVEHEYHQQRKTSLLKMNSRSNPTLSAVDVDCPAVIPRRINTSTSTTTISRGRGVSKSKNKRGSDNNKTKGSKNSGSGKTTVTLTMDNTSLFLDTVFVNVKQDVDSSSTIRLFY